MPRPFPPTWIVVLDSSRACFWRLHHDDNGRRHIDEAAPAMDSHLHAHARDVVSDQPGRYNRGAGQAQHDTFSTEHDPHKLEKHNFIKAVVARLEQAYDAREFARFAVVAPVRSLGEFRALAPEMLKKVLWREIGKDLVKLGRDDLWTRLAPDLADHPG